MLWVEYEHHMNTEAVCATVKALRPSRGVLWAMLYAACARSDCVLLLGCSTEPYRAVGSVTHYLDTRTPHATVERLRANRLVRWAICLSHEQRSYVRCPEKAHSDPSHAV